MTLYRVGISVGPIPRRWDRRLRQVGARAVCRLRGHEWGPWRTDDYDGPCQIVQPDDPGEAPWFMPWLSRESRDGEYGDRHCQRCRASEQRWPDRPFAPKQLPLRER